MQKIVNTFKNRIYRNYIYAFFKDFAFFSAVLVPFFTQWGGLSQTQIQLLQSWFSLWVFILEIPTGAIADKIGRKHSITLGSLIVAFAVLIYGSIPKFEIFLLSEFLFAIGFALASGADDALLYDTLKEEGKEAESKSILGKANSFKLMGMLLAAPIGGLIASNFGVNAPMLASAIPFFIAALIGWSIQEPKVHTEGSESPKYLEIVNQGLKTFRTNPTIKALAIDSVLVSASTYFVFWFYQPLLVQSNIPIQYFGLFHVILMGSQILISSNFATLEKIIGTEKSYLKVSAIITTAAFVLVAVFPNIITIIVFIFCAAGIGSTRATYISGLANRHMVSQQRATVLSSIAMVRRFALIFLNPIAGFTADYSLQLAIFLVGLLPLATLFIPTKAAPNQANITSKQ